LYWCRWALSSLTKPCTIRNFSVKNFIPGQLKSFDFFSLTLEVKILLHYKIFTNEKYSNQTAGENLLKPLLPELRLQLFPFRALPQYLGSCSSSKKISSPGFSTGFDQQPLPYKYDALENIIDAQTMEIHYSKHAKWLCEKFKRRCAR
jgi:hypothetical protein